MFLSCLCYINLSMDDKFICYHKGILFEMTGPSGEIEIKHCILSVILKKKRDNPGLILFPY